MPPVIRRSARLADVQAAAVAAVEDPIIHVAQNPNEVTDTQIINNHAIFIYAYNHFSPIFEQNPTEIAMPQADNYAVNYYRAENLGCNFGHNRLQMKRFFFAYYAFKLFKYMVGRYGRGRGVANQLGDTNEIEKYKVTIRDYNEGSQRLSFVTKFMNPPILGRNFADMAVVEAYITQIMRAFRSLDAHLASQQIPGEIFFNANILIRVQILFIRRRAGLLPEEQMTAEQRRIARANYRENWALNVGRLRRTLNNRNIGITTDLGIGLDDLLALDFGHKKIYKSVQLQDISHGYINPIPFDSRGFCFPLSIVCSQSKIHDYSRDLSIISVCGRSRDVTEEEGNKSKDEYVWFDDIEFRGYSSHTSNQRMCVLNTQLLEEDLWFDLAIILHAHVEDQIGGELSYNKYEECLQSYALVMNCFIHLFVYPYPNRKEVYYPQNIWEQQKIRHVYIYVKDKHIDPIKDINKFLGISNSLYFCDFCQSKLSVTTNKKCNIKHIKNCKSRKNVLTAPILEFSEKVRGGDDYRKYEKIKFTKEEGVDFKCRVCMDELSVADIYGKHICKFKNTYKFEPLPSSKLFVIDIESMQVTTTTQNKFKHECVLLCMRNMYNELNKVAFANEYEFIEYVTKTHIEEFKNSTILAHNGGGYDYQFILRACEKTFTKYTFIPTPNSDHKYLSFNILLPGGSDSIKFIDFMALVPGSLKGIAEAFKLPIQKGDFPHRFLNPDTLHYIGPMPKINGDEDFFCIKQKKDKREVDELIAWHTIEKYKYCTCETEMCECLKDKWDLQYEIKKYCWLDVDVLAMACQKYRDFLLNLEAAEESHQWLARPIDPFCCFTQSQVAINIFMQGCTGDREIYLTKNRTRNGHHWKQFIWLNELDPEIIHLGNSIEEAYIPNLNHYCDGKKGPNVYEFLQCKYDGCPKCFPNRQEINEDRRITYEECYRMWMRKSSELQHGRFNVIQMWECDFECDDDRIHEGTVHQDREIFFGGRTEVFAAYCDKSKFPDDEIKYLDVCSLYPYVCSKKKLPFGIPTYLYMNKIERMRLRPTHPNRYFGFAKIKVTPNPKDRLGLLPRKDDTGRLLFDLTQKVGFWHTEEIYLAMENGYVIDEIYQVIHFEEDQTSEILFRGYMEHWLRVKQESEGWEKLGGLSANPSEEEKDILVDELFSQNGDMARIRKDKVCINPVLRQIAKIFLNCLWGKFCQRQSMDVWCTIDNYPDFQYLCYDCGLDPSDMQFREVTEGEYKVKYTMKKMGRPNKKYNIFIAASVTAHARCILHRQMLVIGPERVLYCDTDSIIFLFSKVKESLVGIGLGKWTDEKKGKTINLFMALAPKCYMIVTNEVDVKAKGLRLTLENKAILTPELFKTLLFTVISHTEEEEELFKDFTSTLTIEERKEVQEEIYNKQTRLPNMTIFPNSTDGDYDYATMFTRYNTKLVRPVLGTKREIWIDYFEEETMEDFYTRISMIYLFPIGYEHN